MAALRQSCAIFCGHLRICDLLINHKNLRMCDLRTGTPKRCADLRKRNEPKNLRICDMQISKSLSPPLNIICSINECINAVQSYNNRNDYWPVSSVQCTHRLCTFSSAANTYIHRSTYITRWESKISYWKLKLSPTGMVDKAGTSLDTDTSAVITTEKLRNGDKGRL
jgi:hypothetical protein